MHPNLAALDMRLLLAFSVISDEGNVTRAAERLGVSQQAVSGMLVRLRELFDDPLFVRSRHGVTATPKAESLAEGVKRLIQGGESLLQSRSFDPSTAEGTLTISALDYVQRGILIPFVNMLTSHAPNIRVAFVPFEMERVADKFYQREIDLAITIPLYAPEELNSRHLFDDPWVCVMRAKHPHRGKSLSLDQFLQYDQVVVSPHDLTFQGAADDALELMGKERRVVVSVTDFLVCCHTVEKSDLIAVVPEVATRFFRKDQLRTYPVPFELKTHPMIAVWPHRVDADPLHRWAREELARMTSW